jgi:hypothetical protein
VAAIFVLWHVEPIAATSGHPTAVPLTAPATAPKPREGPFSTIFVPIRVPLESIAEHLNRVVPLDFRGRELDPVHHRAVIEDTLDWRARRGPIQLGGHRGRLYLRVPAVGEARVRGRARALRGTLGKILRGATGGASDIPFNVRAEVLASLTVGLAPGMGPDWHLEPNARTYVEVHRAEVPIAGIATVDVRPQVRRGLQKKIAPLLQNMVQRVRADDRIRRLAAREWARLHKVESVAGERDMWLTVRPSRVAATTVRTTATAVELGVAIEMETRVSIGEEPPDNPLRPLPPLHSTELRSGQLRLRIPATAPWTELNAVLSDRLGERMIRAEDGATLRLVRAEVAPSGERLLLTVHFDADGGQGYQTTGRLHLTASPRLDPQNQRLYLDELELAVEAKDAMAAAVNWLAGPLVLAHLRRHASLDLSPYVEWARDRAERAIERVVADVPEGIRLSATLKGFSIGDIRISEDDLRLTLEAEGDVGAAITRLDF